MMGREAVELTMKRKRRLVQTAALVLLLLPIWYTDLLWFGTYISADLAGLELTDPLTAFEITLAGRRLWLPLLLSAVPLALAAALLGRVFCSYVCPLNFLLELLPVKGRKNLGNRRLPLVALCIVLVLSLALAVPAFNTVSPVFALMRMMVFGIGIEAALLVMVLLAAFLWGQKIWCRTLCPLGALYGLLGYRRRLFLQVDAEKCVHCGKCGAVCSMGTMPGKGNFEDAVLCTNCGDCVDACHEGAITYTLHGPGA